MDINIEPTEVTTPTTVKRRNGKTKPTDTTVSSYEKIQSQEIIVAPAQSQSLSVFDMQPQEFTTALARREENWKSLLVWIRNNLVEGEDFYRLKISGRETKPSLSKAGAEKICSLLGITSHFSNSEKWEQMLIDGKKIEQVIIRCELKSNGRTIAEGMGARSLQQDKGDLNKCLKMAEKSAFIDATIRCAAVNSVFTQDIEDMTAATSPPQPPEFDTNRKINQSQLEKLIHHMQFSVERRGNGVVTLDAFKERLETWCRKKWHIESWDELAFYQWREVMDKMMTMVAKMEEELNPTPPPPPDTRTEEEIKRAYAQAMIDEAAKWNRD